MLPIKFISPNNFENWNNALKGAYKKGWQCGASGGTKSDCPYQDKRKDCGRLTWSRSFISAWGDGLTDGINARKGYLIEQYYQDRNNSGLAALAK